MINFIFWATVIVSGILVFRKADFIAGQNVMGYTKVNGEWKQTMHPDHYCFAATYLMFYFGAFAVVVAIFFGLSRIMEVLGHPVI